MQTSWILLQNNCDIFRQAHKLKYASILVITRVVGSQPFIKSESRTAKKSFWHLYREDTINWIWLWQGQINFRFYKDSRAYQCHPHRPPELTFVSEEMLCCCHLSLQWSSNRCVGVACIMKPFLLYIISCHQPSTHFSWDIQWHSIYYKVLDVDRFWQLDLKGKFFFFFFKWSCMRYLCIVSILPTVDSDQCATSLEKQTWASVCTSKLRAQTAVWCW